MRKMLLFGSCLVALLVAPGSAMAASGSISGTVVDAGASAPIAGIQVCAWEFEHQFTPGGCEVTDAAGEYTIAGLEPGAYAVEFATYHEFGYDNRYWSEKATFASSGEVVVTSETTTAGIDAALIFGGAIEGTVTSSKTEEPLAGAQVCAQDLADPADIICVFTNAAGHYVAPGLGTAEYKVRFLKETKGKPVIRYLNPVFVVAPNITSGVDYALPV
jgi:hypothetical protein